MTDTAQQPHPVGALPLWFGLLAGHTAWSAQLLVNYFLVSLACALEAPGFLILTIGGFEFLMLLVTLATGAVSLAAAVVAYKAWQHTGVGSRTGLGGPGGRSGFMAVTGLLLSSLFFVTILLGGLANVFLNPCST